MNDLARPKMGARGAAGLTLIEVMIVVAVISILAAIAYPSYRDSVLKGKRAEARAALAELLQQQERYSTQNNTYLVFTNTTGTTNPSAVPFKIQAGEGTASYWLSAQLCPASAGGAVPSANSCIQVVATPVQPDPTVGDLALTSTGVKSCTGSASSSNFRLCWP